MLHQMQMSPAGNCFILCYFMGTESSLFSASDNILGNLRTETGYFFCHTVNRHNSFVCILLLYTMAVQGKNRCTPKQHKNYREHKNSK